MQHFHQQSFYESADELLRAEHSRLARLIGRRVSAVWTAHTSAGEWFVDEPVVICCDDLHLEIAVYQIGLLAITWNTVDFASPANWLGCWDPAEYGLEWRTADHPVLATLVGNPITAIDIVSSPCGLDGVRLHHPLGVAVLYNALDELGVSDRDLDGAAYSTHRIA